MSKIINISKDRLCFLQKALSLTSVIASIGILALILLGAIPFGAYNTNGIGLLSLFFTIVDLGKRALIHIICNVAFSVLYVFVCIKSILKIIKMIKNRKTWLFSKMDSNPVRAAVNFRVEGFNEIAWYFLLLTMASVLVNGCQFSPFFTAIIVAVFVVIAIINVVRFICVKRILEESIIVPISKLLTMLGALLFTICVCKITLPELWIGVGRFGILLNDSTIPARFVFDAFFNTIIVPIVQFFILYVLIRYAFDAFISYVDITDSTKKLAIFSSVCVGVMMLFDGIIDEYHNPEQYLNMLINKGILLIIPWFVFFISKCTTITVPDCPLYDPAPGERGLGDTDEPADAVTEESDTEPITREDERDNPNS